MKAFIITFVLCLIATSSFAWCRDDQMSDAEYSDYIAKCPFGDAVMMSKQNKSKTISTECVNLSADNKHWVVIVNDKIIKLPTDKWDAYTMDYHLMVIKGKLYREQTYNRPEDIKALDRMIMDYEAEKKVSAMFISPLF